MSEQSKAQCFLDENKISSEEKGDPALKKDVVPSPEGVDENGKRIFYTMPRTKRHIAPGMEIPRFLPRENPIGIPHLSDISFLGSRQNTEHLIVDVKDRERRVKNIGRNPERRL